MNRPFFWDAVVGRLLSFSLFLPRNWPQFEGNPSCEATFGLVALSLMLYAFRLFSVLERQIHHLFLSTPKTTLSTLQKDFILKGKMSNLNAIKLGEKCQKGEMDPFSYM